MWHVKSISAILILPAFACVACGQAHKREDSSTNAAEQAASVQEGNPGIAGTYTSDTVTAGEFSQLVLKTDASFHSATFVVCVAPPCNPVQQDGSYRIFRRDKRNYMVFMGREGTVLDTYQFAQGNNSLFLRRVPSPVHDTVQDRRWHMMPRSTTAWCAESSDCALQNLPIGPCAGDWLCGPAAVCNWSCLPVSAE